MNGTNFWILSVPIIQGYIIIFSIFQEMVWYDKSPPPTPTPRFWMYVRIAWILIWCEFVCHWFRSYLVGSYTLNRNNFQNIFLKFGSRSLILCNLNKCLKQLGSWFVSNLFSQLSGSSLVGSYILKKIYIISNLDLLSLILNECPTVNQFGSWSDANVLNYWSWSKLVRILTMNNTILKKVST